MVAVPESRPVRTRSLTPSPLMSTTVAFEGDVGQRGRYRVAFRDWILDIESAASLLNQYKIGYGRQYAGGRIAYQDVVQHAPELNTDSNRVAVVEFRTAVPECCPDYCLPIAGRCGR